MLVFRKLTQIEATSAVLETRYSMDLIFFFFSLLGPEHHGSRFPNYIVSQVCMGPFLTSPHYHKRISQYAHFTNILIEFMTFQPRPTFFLTIHKWKKSFLHFDISYHQTREKIIFSLYLLTHKDDLLFWVYYDANIGGECFICLHAYHY